MREAKRLFLSFLLLMSSCELSHTPLLTQVLAAPEGVRIGALAYAREYEKLGAVYEWGGQDPLPRTIAVDCSGLVIRCYQYSCEDVGLRLPFADTTAKELYERYSLTVAPEPGDLVFMGDGEVSHVALFIRKDDSVVYLIDSTTLSGCVSERQYPEGSSKIISFGRMLVGR